MKNDEKIQVRVSHRFAASAERVFDAWLDPEKACRFLFATAHGHVVRTEIDARVGGGFVIVDRRAGEDVEHVGTYLELVRPRRLVFTFSVPRYSDGRDADTVTVEIDPLPSGCLLTLTHEMGQRQAEHRGRAQEGWQGILEVLAEMLPPAAPTCGEGLAQHASVPGKIAPLLAALADTLELHRDLLDPVTPQAREEDDAYRELARRYRELAQGIADAATRMAECRGLAPCPHDTSAFGPQHLAAFQRFVKTQRQLLDILRPAAERDQKLLETMSQTK
jgi:uncharacterized protein YndB with AHSA1/START domain